MNTTTTANSPILIDGKFVSVNDIVAVSNKNDGFRIGKVIDIQGNTLNITLFHFKMDIRTQMIMDEDILFNFGPHQAKSIFEMSDEHQRILLDRIYERMTVSASLSLMEQMKMKEKALATMETKIEQLFDRLFLVDDYPRLITQIVDDKIIDYEKAISLIFNQAQKTSSTTQLDLLARLLAEICWKKQSLEFIEYRMNSNNESNKTFFKICFREIGHLIGTCTNNIVNVDFTIHYARLVSGALDSYSVKSI